VLPCVAVTLPTVLSWLAPLRSAGNRPYGADAEPADFPVRKPHEPEIDRLHIGGAIAGSSRGTALAVMTGHVRP